MARPTYVISGAGSGIGRAAAARLAQGGARLVLCGRTASRLEETREALEGEGHQVASFDVRDREAVVAGLDAALGEGPDLAGVVANAGVGGPNEFGPEDRWDEVLSTNLTGVYHLVSACIPRLRASQHPARHVVVVSSVLARLGVPGYTAYCASKAGLLGLVRCWAAELARDQVRVNALCPGWVDTAMAREGIEGFAADTGVSFDEARAQQLAMVPLRRMSTPEEIAAWVAFLVEGAQVSLTGQALDINNGAVMTP